MTGAALDRLGCALIASAVGALVWMATGAVDAPVPGGGLVFVTAVAMIGAPLRRRHFAAARAVLASASGAAVLFPFTASDGNFGQGAWRLSAALYAILLAGVAGALHLLPTRARQPPARRWTVTAGTVFAVLASVGVWAMWPDPWTGLVTVADRVSLPSNVTLMEEQRFGWRCTSKCGPTLVRHYEAVGPTSDLCVVALDNVDRLTTRHEAIGGCGAQGDLASGRRLEINAGYETLEVTVSTP